LKNKNTYKNAEITESAATSHLSALHNSTIRINQYVWDMMKMLEKEEMFGFHFEAKLGAKKVLIILHHEDKEALKKAQQLLSVFKRERDFLFLTKVTENSGIDKRWFIFYFFILLVIFLLIVSAFYPKDGFNLFTKSSSEVVPKLITQTSEKNITVEEIEVDIEKLKALKESFEEQNSTSLSPKVMKALSITTDIVSEVVSEEEKAKYSSEALVKRFKGKSGFKLVVKEDKNNEDFNLTVQELNDYAMHFVKENNLSEALKYYDKVSTENNATKKEQLIASFHQGEIFEEMGLNEEAKEAYEKSLKVSRSLKEEEGTIGALNELVNLGHLAKVNLSLDDKEVAEKHLKKSKQIYDLLIMELKKFGEVKDSELALALNYLANFYDENDKDLLAIDMRKEALKIYEKLLEKEYEKFALSYYKTVNSLGHSYAKVDHSDFAIREYERALHFMKEAVSKKVLKNRVFISNSYVLLGKANLLVKKLKESDKYYHKALNIYHLLVKKEPSYLSQLTQMHGLFAELYKIEEKFELASKEYTKGIDTFTEMNQEGKGKYNLEIANLLNDLAIMKISKTKEIEQAKRELQEAKKLALDVLRVHFQKAKESIVKSYLYLGMIAMNQKKLALAADYSQKAYFFKTLKGIKGLKSGF